MSEDKRIEELDQFRDAAIAWWRAIDYAMNMYARSLKNERELRLVIKRQEIEIEDLKKMLDILEPEWMSKLKKKEGVDNDRS